eukprot:5518490-Pyramimonas_sp.AAC.1
MARYGTPRSWKPRRQELVASPLALGGPGCSEIAPLPLAPGPRGPRCRGAAGATRAMGSEGDEGSESDEDDSLMLEAMRRNEC